MLSANEIPTPWHRMGIQYLLNISFWKSSPVKEATIHICNFGKEYITHSLSLLIRGECLLSSLPVLLSPLETSMTAFRNLILTTIITRFLSLSWEYWNSPKLPSFYFSHLCVLNHHLILEKQK